MMFRVWLRSFGAVEKEEGSLQLAGTAEPQAAASFQLSAPQPVLPAIARS